MLDDDLIGSRAGDIENQSRNDRHDSRDSDGPVADTIADSHAGCSFRMLLCMKREMEIDNDFGMFNMFPNLKSILRDVRIKFNKRA